MTTLQRVRHYSEYDLCRASGNAFTGVISITEPDRYVDGLDEERWATVLRLYFHDLDKPWQNYVLFDVSMADQIIDWLEQAQDLKGIYCHCAAGISRSAAVAKFIADVYGLFFDERRGARYNRLVYRVLMDRALERGFVTAEQLLKGREP